MRVEPEIDQVPIETRPAAYFLIEGRVDTSRPWMRRARVVWKGDRAAALRAVCLALRARAGALQRGGDRQLLARDHHNQRLEPPDDSVPFGPGRHATGPAAGARTGPTQRQAVPSAASRHLAAYEPAARRAFSASSRRPTSSSFSIA